MSSKDTNLSIFSFSKTATPASMSMGGGVESKLDLLSGDRGVSSKNKFRFHLKSGGGFSMSTVVIFSATVFSSASKYRSIKYSWYSQRRWLKALPGKIKAPLGKGA